MVLRASAAAFLVLSVGSAHGQVYKWTDAEGKVHYGEQRPPTAEAAIVRPSTVPAPAAQPPGGPQSPPGRQPLGGAQAPGGVPRTPPGGRPVLSTDPGATNSSKAQEAAFQARRAARQRSEDAEADAVAKTKQKEAVRRAKENRETVAKMKQESLQSDRTYNRNRQVTPEVRQQDLNRAYEDAARRRRAGESTERTY